MVSSIVGSYLVDKGLITVEQLNDLMAEQQKVRVKLGLIAVAEGLMTQDQAEKVNALQAVMDKRFGDIAVSKGYLTDGQVEALLKKQGNAYLAFAQALENQQLMTVDQLEQYMVDFQHENQLTASDIDDLKSDDVDRILPLYMPIGYEKYAGVAGTAVRTLMRCIDNNVYPGKAVLAESYDVDNCAVQYVEGAPAVTCCMAGKGNALLPVASIFGKEDFEAVDADALDAIGELLNCINGLYASALSQEGITMELCPPEYYAEAASVQASQMLVLPLYIKNEQIDFIVAVDNKIEVK
ncbi:MAG: chemotaxis protein CheX [Lachnospiraceae bacterium]|nr:chemotaxis protein CheX [Lachnospiraceae bacterium]